jgi:DNA-binding MarR family transcriptional regulator
LLEAINKLNLRVDVAADPADRRSWLVSLTAAGTEEVQRLQQIGLNRFATFVAGWDPSEERTLTALITKLEQSKAAAGKREAETIPTGGRTRHRVPRRERE